MNPEDSAESGMVSVTKAAAIRMKLRPQRRHRIPRLFYLTFFPLLGSTVFIFTQFHDGDKLEVITPRPVTPAPALSPSSESVVKKTDINATSTVAVAPETTTTSSSIETTTPTTPTTPPLPEYLDPELITLKASGPDTFCPRFISGVGFTERVTFLEVSGESCLFPRSVCGIESTARANPEMQIYVYFNTNPNMKPQKQYNVKKPGKIRSCYVTEVLKQFANVHFIHEDLVEYIRESKFWTLYEKGTFNESSWSYVHFSDALRLVLLEKYGGFYLDSDIVTFRPLHCLRNAASYINEAPNIENGIIVFDKHHPFLNFLIKYLVQTYDPEQRMSIGPPKLAAAYQLYCGLKLRSRLRTGLFKCHNNTEINLLDPDSFFPVKHYEMYTFFTETFGYFDHNILLQRSFLTHVYGAGWGKPAPLTSLYASLARQYCPSTWNATHEAEIEFGF